MRNTKPSLLPLLTAIMLSTSNAPAQTTFTKITTGPVVTDPGQFTIAAWGDINNDSSLDLVVPNFSRANVLYTNNGDGTFTKITSGDPVLDVADHTAAAFADYDN